MAEPTKYDGLLCENELLLDQSLSEIFTRAMTQGGLGQLPEEYRKEPSGAYPRADTSKYVLAVFLEASELALNNVQESKLMQAGDCLICSYEAVRRHVVDGRVRLM